MTSRTLKLLTASTAFIAAASAGHADTVNTTVTNTLHTSDTVGGFTVTGAGIVSVSGGPAIRISGTNAVSNSIQVNAGGMIRSTSNTIELSSDPVAGTGAVTINNSGTIAQVGGQAGAAINLTGMTNAATINNAGSISGTILFGNGTNALTSTGTTSGTITGGTGGDTFTFTGATHTGDLATGAGGTDSVTVSNSTVNGNISNGAGSTLGLTLTNATVNGTMTDNNGGGDSITINGQNTFTTGGAISGFEDLNFDTSVNINHAITGAATIDLAAGKTANFNEGVTISGALTNNGVMNVAAGKVLSANSLTSGAASSVGLHVSDSSSIGKLTLTTGLAADHSLTIIFDASSGYIASGTQYVIADGGTHTDAGHITNANTGVYRLSTAINGSDEIELTVGRVSTDEVVQGADNKAIAAQLDTISSSAVGTLQTVQGLIGQQSTAAGVENIVESLAPSIDGAGMVAVNVTVDTGNQISDRLASIRSTSGVATGDAMASQHMWVQGFGSTVEQDDKRGNSGYDASAGGVSLGVDTDTLVDGMTTGLAFSYARGKVDSNASSGATTDIDSYIGTLYGSRVLDGGVFVNGQLGLGYSKYDMERTVIGVGQATGDTNGWQGTAKVETGKDFAVGGLTLTPLASLQYTYLDMDSYTETGAGGASLHVKPESLSTVDAGAGGQVAYAIPLSDGGTLKPSLHAKYIYRMGDREMGTTSSFTGGGASFNTNGVEADRSSVNLGAGLLLTTIGGTDLSLNYDADIRSSLTGHTGQLKARWAF